MATMTPRPIENIPQVKPSPVSPPQLPPPKQAKSHAWIWIVVVLIVLLIVAVGAMRYFHSGDGAQAADNKARQSPPIPVVAVASHKGDMPIYLNGLGTVSPLNTVTVHTRVDGELISVNYEEGQLVTEGQLLAQIDPRPYQVQLTQAQGQLAKDQAALTNAQVELDRDKQAAEALPKQTVDTQQATVDQAQAAIKIDQGVIDNINLQLTYCRVTAEISGRIGLRLVDKGNIVHASDATGIAVITQLQPISVIFSVSEDDLPSVVQNTDRGIGLIAEAYDRSFTRKLASGKLQAVDNQVDPTTGSVKLKAIFPNEDNMLFPSQFVNVRLLVNTLHNMVIVPAAAVQRGPENTFVYVVKNDEVEVRPVITGPTEADQMVITKGLDAGEMVVTDGVDKLQAGTKVSIRQSGGNSTTKPGGATHPATSNS